MAQANSNNKVSIYPFEVNIESSLGPQKANAYTLTAVGMMLEVYVNTFSPQQPIKIKWVLPVDNISMEGDAVVVKKYSQQRGEKIQYLMEIHFRNIKFQHQEAIKSLLERLEKMKKGEEKKS